MAKNGLTALQRKAGVDRPPPDHGVMTPAKALRLALARAGDDLLGATILTGTVEEARSTVPQMAEFIDEGALVMLLQGDGRSRGLAILDAGALAAVIEALTTRRITPGEAPVPAREPTATDAFLARRFLTVIAGAFASHLAAIPDASWARPFSATEQVRDVRNLPLLLDDLAFRVISAQVDFDAGARSGRFRLVLPWVAPRPAPKALPAPSAAEGGTQPPQEPGQTEEALRALMQGEVTLEAVLHRQRLPLATLLRWKAGDLVTFPAHAIAAVAAIDAAGVRVATARLGQSGGQRALKLIRSDLTAEGGLSSLARARAMMADRNAGSDEGPAGAGGAPPRASTGSEAAPSGPEAGASPKPPAGAQPVPAPTRAPTDVPVGE